MPTPKEEHVPAWENSKNAVAEDSGGGRRLDVHQAGHSHCGHAGRSGRNIVLVAIALQDLVGAVFESELGGRGREYGHAQYVDWKDVLCANPVEQVWLRKRGHGGAAHVGAHVGFPCRTGQRVAYIPNNIGGRSSRCDFSKRGGRVGVVGGRVMCEWRSCMRCQWQRRGRQGEQRRKSISNHRRKRCCC